MEIKNNDVYQDMIARFMPATFKDKALEMERDKTSHVKETANEIDDTKEWEGVYPNKLDSEMQDYTYGDKVTPNYYNNYWDHNYRRNQYNNIYNKDRGYNPNNKWNRHTGWGFQDTGSIAPKFDPNSHFESPYYDYDNYGWRTNGDYWSRMKTGPYSNNDISDSN